MAALGASGPGESWPAPAKLNLFLHILGRRPDGLHELQTAFQFIDLVDELDFEPRTDGRVVRLEGPAEVPEAEDLVVRAARRLKDATSSRAGIGIRVRKRIPLQAGLGGGSSDAATTLVALNSLWRLGLKEDELRQLALGLGADVPVFVHGRAAWAEGVGERLQDIDPPERAYVVVQPDCRVRTAEIFQAPELTRNSAAITIRAFFEAGAAGNTRNDCDQTVFARYPQVAAARDWLAARAPAQLTGTGACVFAAVESEERGREILRALPSSWRGFRVHGCNRSPLLDRLARETS